MRLFEYLLKFGFMYAVSLGLLLGLGPWLWHMASDSSQVPVSFEEITGFELFTPNPQAYGAENYLGFRLTTTKNEDYQRIFYVPDGEHLELIETLYNLQLLNETIALSEQLPVSWTIANNPKFLHSLAYKLEEGAINQLWINDEIVVGQRSSIKIFLQYTVAALFVLVGFVGFIVITMELVRQLKIFNRTGELPELPNSVDAKWEGLKFLIRGFRPKEKGGESTLGKGNK